MLIRISIGRDLNMGQTYYIADLHFGHTNILKLDNRPFWNVQEMEHAMISNWNSKVDNGDTVYIIGDFCWNAGDEWVRLLNRLDGQKHLILGNHDTKRITPEAKRHFVGVYDYKEITDNGRRVIMCHYPMPFYRSDYNDNVYHLYGHVHTTIEEHFMQKIRKMILDEDNRGDSSNKCQFYNLWCGYYNYTPVTLDEVIAYWNTRIK